VALTRRRAASASGDSFRVLFCMKEDGVEIIKNENDSHYIAMHVFFGCE
jgi:hypothetical protein